MTISLERTLNITMQTKKGGSFIDATRCILVYGLYKAVFLQTNPEFLPKAPSRSCGSPPLY
ncbi:MAG TPA: hypothetical protein DEB10_00440 [Ruminococcaceae bacterium]|jgi:hypothetical protein|nr:hypothetical protein [Oscillospiraceae bacterium]